MEVAQLLLQITEVQVRILVVTLLEELANTETDVALFMMVLQVVAEIVVTTEVEETIAEMIEDVRAIETIEEMKEMEDVIDVMTDAMTDAMTETDAEEALQEEEFSGCCALYAGRTIPVAV